MAYDLDPDSQDNLNEAYRAVGKGANRAFNKATSGIRRKASQARNKLIKKGAKLIGEAMLKGIQILAKLLLPFLPYILIALVVFIIIFFAWDFFFNSKGTTETYQTEDSEEMNEVEMSEDGTIKATELSMGNKIVKAFYTYFSERSLWVTVEKNGGGKIVEEPLQYNSVEFINKFGEDGNGGTTGEKLKDKYGRESMFMLNPNALYVLDEFLNKGSFKFPEQFVKPVYYDKNTYELKNLANDEGKLEAESTVYKANGNGQLSPTNEKEKGVWDYGFGSIANFVQYEENYENRGTYTTMKLWNVTKSTITGELEKADAEQLLENTKNNPYKDDASYDENHPEYSKYGDVYIFDMSKVPDEYKLRTKTDLVYLINRVTSPAGFIENEIYYEWEQDTSKPFKTETKYSNKVKVRVSYEENVYDYDYDDLDIMGNPIYKLCYIDNKTGETVFDSKDEDGKKNKVKTETKWKFEEKDMELSAYATGYEWSQIPRYVGEPDTSKITGNKYFTDYMLNYKTYVPEDVMTEFNFNERTNKTDEELLKILEKTTYDDTSSSTSSIDLSNFKLGEGASSDSFTKSMQYFDVVKPIAESWGIDPYYVIAMIAQESGGNINADNNGYGFGLMQLEMTVYNGKTITGTKPDGTKVSHTVSYDALRNNAELQIEIGCMELRGQLVQYGNLINALQAYNTGQGGFLTIVAKYASVKYGLAYQNVMYSYQSAELKAKTQEIIKSNDLGWLEYRQWYKDEGWHVYPGAGGGNPQHIEMVLQYYMSVDGETPWFIDDEGNKISMDGSSIPTGTASSGVTTYSSANSSSQDSWLKRGWNTIKKSFNSLFPEKEPQLKAERIEFENSQDENNTETYIKMMFVMEEKQLLSYYDDFTSDNWKASFTKLFSNPMGGQWNGKTNSIIDTEGWFPNGYCTPLDGDNTIQNPYNPPSHYGIDIVATVGSSVKAVADGKVTQINRNSNSAKGKSITITHSNGVKTIYANLAEILVKENDTITKGQVIGKTGDCKEGRVLHFELEQNGQKSDPTWIVSGIFNASDYNMDSTDAEIIEKVINLAKTKLKCPYTSVEEVKAGVPRMGPNNFDCSGLTYYVYHEITGVNIGVTTWDQASKLQGTMFTDMSKLQPGDIIMPANKEHVALYIGNGRVIHAKGKAYGVVEGSIGSGYYTIAFRPLAYINRVKG